MSYTKGLYDADINAFCGKHKASFENSSKYAVNDLVSKTIQEEIVQIQDKVIGYLNDCLLDGSYVILDEFSIDLGGFEDSFQKAQDKVLNDFAVYPDFPSNDVVDEIKTSIEKIGSFKRFIDNIERKFLFLEKQFFVNESIHGKSSRLDFKNAYRSNLFYANLFVAECDHFVSNSDIDSLQKLEEIIEYLNNTPDRDRQGEMVYRKAYFLRHKITLRTVEHLRSLDKSSTIYLSSNSGDNQPFKPEIFIEESYLRPFRNWNEYLFIHYELYDDWKNRLKQNSDPSSDLRKLKVLDLHRLIKYAKDAQSNSILLQRIRVELEYRLKNTRSKSDEYASKVCLSYCYNNEFSLLVQSEDSDQNLVIHLYNEIMDCPELLQIKNYFVPALMLSFNTNLLKRHFDSDTLFENLDECERILKECDIIKGKYIEGISWVKSNYNYVFQLPMEECKVNFRDNNYIFVYSSCFLPIARNHIEYRFKRDIENLRIFRASIDNLKITKPYIQTFKLLTDELKETKEGFIKRETKAMEIIALVSAILTFVAGSMPGFKFIDSGIKAITFTISLGSSLVLFSLIFYLISRGIRNIKEITWPFIIGISMVLISWVFLYVSFHESSVVSKKTELDNKDSKNTNTNIQIISPINNKEFTGDFDTVKKTRLSGTSKRRKCNCPKDSIGETQ